jgi:hypothetical protein
MKRIIIALLLILAMFTVLGLSWHSFAGVERASVFSKSQEKPTPTATPAPTASPSPSPSGTPTPVPEPEPVTPTPTPFTLRNNSSQN